MKIVITCPYSLDSLHGNVISARRIAGILKDAGHEVGLMESSDDLPADTEVLIALHARKSHGAVMQAVKLGEVRVILYLTGTDLYGHMQEGCKQCEESLDVADAVVVSQEASFASVPEKYQSKTQVVYNSIELPELPELDQVEQEDGLFVIASHLREVKQPFLVAEALGLLDEGIRVKLMGKVLDEGSDELALQWMSKEGKFEWLGEQTYEQTLKWMLRSVATVNTSLSEGGANSIGESIMLGVPVLASKIEGNIGMLGEDYEGYFDAGSAEELSELMQRLMGDVEFRNLLEGQIKKRAKKYSRENEARGWLGLL